MTFSKEVYLVAWNLLSDRAYVKILGCLDEWPTFCREGVPFKDALNCACSLALVLTDFLAAQIREWQRLCEYTYVQQESLHANANIHRHFISFVGNKYGMQIPQVS